VRLALLILALAAGACARAAPRCDREAAHEIAFTGAEKSETVIARSIGAACNKAIGVYTLLDAEARPLWSWSAPLERAYGDVFPVGDHEAMDDFLQRWAEPTLARTPAAPEWELLAPGQSALDRTTYEDLRARDLPMLCHYSGAARETCVFWEPAAGLAGHFYDRDAEAAPEPDPAEAPQ
jgi:hypothetical protein